MSGYLYRPAALLQDDPNMCTYSFASYLRYRARPRAYRGIQEEASAAGFPLCSEQTVTSCKDKAELNMVDQVVSCCLLSDGEMLVRLGK